MAKAKAKAKEPALLERVVVGPKPIWAIDPETGERRAYNVGDTIWLPPHQAKSKARYLQAPEVAKAQLAAKAAEEEAVAKEEAETKISIEAAPTGGDSEES